MQDSRASNSAARRTDINSKTRMSPWWANVIYVAFEGRWYGRCLEHEGNGGHKTNSPLAMHFLPCSSLLGVQIGWIEKNIDSTCSKQPYWMRQRVWRYGGARNLDRKSIPFICTHFTQPPASYGVTSNGGANDNLPAPQVVSAYHVCVEWGKMTIQALSHLDMRLHVGPSTPMCKGKLEHPYGIMALYLLFSNRERGKWRVRDWLR